MFAVKLPANLVVAIDFYIVLNIFEHVSLFYISHITWIINYNWSLLKAVNVFMFMFNSNKPINVAHLQKLANQSLLNGALGMEMVNNSFSESKKNFDRFIKRKKF